VSELKEKVLEIFSDILELEISELNDETSPDNTSEWDSLAAMHLVSAIEETFSISLSTGEIMKMRSIGIVQKVIQEKEVS
tara:strand:+ start:3100 stop:3339 length:240 start_codon:yes stop_codon:yes gene_type:complete